MASIYKKNGSKNYTIAYINAKGKTVMTPGYRDKTATVAKAARLEKEAQREREGIRPTTKKPVEQAQNEYIEELVRRGSDKDGPHVKETKRILTAFIGQIDARYVNQINDNHVNQYIRIHAGKAPRTQNRHHKTLRAFFNFCIEHKWLQASPIASKKMARVGQAGTRHNRRAFTDDELKKLFETTPNKRRLAIYKVAAFSGLRRQELEHIKVVDCDPLEPRWYLRPNVTKNRQGAILPMTKEAAKAILPYWRFPQPDQTIFGSIPHIVTLHSDLKAAGIKRIDENGNRLDFHSFRYTFCRLMSRHLPIQKVKLLMRHSTIKLTADLYGKLGLEDLADDTWSSLPQLLPEPPQASEKKPKNSNS